MKKTRKTICFAYYGDGKFLGWYADTFGSIRTIPKTYGNSEHQVGVIERNFRNKMRRLTGKGELDSVKVIDSHNGVAGGMLKSGLDADEKILNEYSIIELRIAKCPIYNGPNPDYSKTINDAFRENDTKLYHQWCKEMNLEPGIKPGDRIGIATLENYKRFKEVYPDARPKSWIYGDWEKIKEWASNEPEDVIKFVEVNIKANEVRTS